MNASFQGDAIRIVTHRDVNRQQLETVAKKMKEALNWLKFLISLMFLILDRKL